MRGAMRITCPICDAHYELPPALAAKLPARTRCAGCGNEWVAQAAEPADIATPSPARPEPVAFETPAPASPPPAEPLPAETAPDLPPPAEPDRRKAAGTPADRVAPPPQVFLHTPSRPAPDPLVTRLLWLGSIGLVFLLIILVLALHGPIGTTWPPSLRLYHALGIA